MHLPEKNRVDMLNVLKFIAFMCIFLLHTKIFLPMPWNETVPMPWLTFTPAWGGVWIFFVLSGYGIGYGFYKNKYKTSAKGIIKYYIGRFVKIVPLYWFYILIVSVFITPEILQPSIEHITQLLSLLFFQYQSEFYSIEFGLAWYMTTLVRLYLLAPFIYLLFKHYVDNTKKTYSAIFIFIVVGLVARCLMYYHISSKGGDWSSEVYQPFYFNLDSFCAGMLLSSIERPSKEMPFRKGIQLLVLCCLFLLIAINSYLYYYGSYGEKWKYLLIYSYALPSVYIAGTCIYIYVFELCKEYKNTKLSATAVRKNPMRICDYFPRIQMEMYLFHSTVLLTVQKGYSDELYQLYMRVLRLDGTHIEWFKSCLFTVLAFAVTTVFSIVIAWLFENKPSKMTVQKIEVVSERIVDKVYKNGYKLLQVLFPVEE